MLAESAQSTTTQSAWPRSGAPSFPEELVGYIAEYVCADDDVKTLLALQRVSKEGYRVATPHIYRYIDLDTPERLERLFRPLTVKSAFAKSEDRHALTDHGLDFIKSNGFCRVQMDRTQAHYEVKREASRIRALESTSSVSGLPVDRLVSTLQNLAIGLGLTGAPSGGDEVEERPLAQQGTTSSEDESLRTSRWTPDDLQRVRNAFRLVEKITLRFSTIATTATRPMLATFLASWLLCTERPFPRLDSITITQSAVAQSLTGTAYREAASVPQITEFACLQALLCRLDPRYCCFEDSPATPGDLEPSSLSLHPIVLLRVYPVQPHIRLQTVRIHAQEMSYRLISHICCVVGRVPKVHVSLALPTANEDLVALLRPFLQLSIAVNAMLDRGHPHGQKHDTDVHIYNTTTSGDRLYDLRLMETYSQGVSQAVLRQAPQFVTAEDGRMAVKHVRFGDDGEIPQCPSCSTEVSRRTGHSCI